MSGSTLDVIPADRQDITQAALSATFGGAAIAGFAQVPGGASGALAYRFETRGRTYLMRIEIPRDALRDARRGFACMRIAAEAGIAPPLHFADPETGVAIMDFIVQQPQQAYPGGAPVLAAAVGDLIGRLHETELFPPLLDYRVILQHLTGALAASPAFAPGLLEPHLAACRRLVEAYPWGEDGPVSSHNDPNGRNILFDGKLLWLIDWETGYRNDPMVDVAIAAGEYAATPEIGAAILQAAFRRPPDARLLARLRVMYLLTRIYYAGLFTAVLRVAPPGGIVSDLAAPTLAQFHAAMADGRLKHGSPELMISLVKMGLASFTAGMADPRLEPALALLAGG